MNAVGAVMLGVGVLDMAANHLDGPIGQLANYAMKPLMLFNRSVFGIFTNPAFQSGWRNRGPPRGLPPPEYNPFVEEANAFSNYWNETQLALTRRLQIESEQSLRERLAFRLIILQDRRQAILQATKWRDIRGHYARIALSQPQIKEYQSKMNEIIKVIDNKIEIGQKHINEADKDIANYKQSLTKPSNIPAPQQPKNKPIKKVQLLEPAPVQLLNEYEPQLSQQTKPLTPNQEAYKRNTQIVSVTPIDQIVSMHGAKNLVLLQNGQDFGGRINISSKGVISITNIGRGYISGPANLPGGVRFNLIVE